LLEQTSSLEGRLPLTTSKGVQLEVRNIFLVSALGGWAAVIKDGITL
jgi:hypothetical protein